jgi:hypothetical protein
MAISRHGTGTKGGLFSTGSPYTLAHTCGSGADRLLIVGGFASNADLITGASYNGVPMTLIDKRQGGGGTDRIIYLWYLLNPATGTHNVVVTGTPDAWCFFAIDYDGVKQSGQPDGSANNVSAGTTSLTASWTVTAANSWGLAFSREGVAGTLGWTGATNVMDGDSIHLGDTNGSMGTGSQSITATMPTSSIKSLIAVSFAPAAAGTGIALVPAINITGSAVSSWSSSATPVDTTGVDLITIAIARAISSSPGPDTDSKGNTYTLAGETLVGTGGSTTRVGLYYKQNPARGSGHYWSFNPGNQYFSIAVRCWSGSATSPVANQSGTYATNAPSLALPALTPSEANCLVLTAWAINNRATPYSISSPLTGLNEVSWVDLVNIGLALSYSVQTTAASITPTLTLTGSVFTTEIAGLCVAFKAAAAAASISGTVDKTLDTLTCAAEGTIQTFPPGSATHVGAVNQTLGTLTADSTASVVAAGPTTITGTLEQLLAPLTLAGGTSDAGVMTVSYIDVTGDIPLDSLILPPVTGSFIVAIFTNEPLLKVTPGPGNTVQMTAVSSDPARHPDIVLGQHAVLSDLAIGPEYWDIGKAVLGFNDTVNLSGCTGVTFTITPTTLKTNWHHFTSVDGDPVPTDLSGKTLVLTVGPGVLGGLTQQLEPLTVSARGVASRYGNLVTADGAAGYWPLDDPAGSTIARDVVGTRTGTLVGGVVSGVGGLFGRAMAFYSTTTPGAPGYINLGAGPPALATAFSIELWCLPWTHNSNHALMCKSPVGSLPAPTPGFFLFHVFGSALTHPPGPPQGLIVTANDPTNATVLGSRALVLGAWQHVAMTYTPSGTIVRLYLDGVLDNSYTVPMGEDDGSLVTYIGDRPLDSMTSGRGWDGLLQAVAWYPSVLSDAQILEHYQLGIALAGRRIPLSVLALVGDDDMLKYNLATPITTSDTVALPRLTDAIYVGVTGDIAVVLQNGVTRTFTDVSAGSILPIAASRVNATATTAGSLLALYQQ